MEIRLASKLQTDSIVDGEGLRAVIWTQGCPHKCKGCHNAHTWDSNQGFLYDIEKIKNELSNLLYHDGITLSGGEPFRQPKECLEIVKYAKSLGLNVWSYSGYTFEELLGLSLLNPDVKELLQNIDILIDGRFVLEKKSLNVKYRGSTNQRILDAKASLKKKKAVVLTDFDKSISGEFLYHKEEFLFI